MFNSNDHLALSANGFFSDPGTVPVNLKSEEVTAIKTNGVVLVKMTLSIGEFDQCRAKSIDGVIVLIVHFFEGLSRPCDLGCPSCPPSAN